MSMSDPIADLLTRIRNGQRANHMEVRMPAANEKAAIAKVLQEQGFLDSVETMGEGVARELVLGLKYYQSKPVISGLKRVSKPSCRVYVKTKEIPRVRNGMGVAVLSTPEGVMAGKEAKRRNVGGEIICYVW